MTQSDTRVAVYTGSFDPITLGHLNVIQRSSRLVDRLIVGVGVNVGKTPMFSPEERVELVERVTADCGNVEVTTFSGLAVKFVRECNSRVMVRGVRPLTEAFADSAAFTWLQAQAAQFGFTLPYTADNEWGITYEPWHWYLNQGLTDATN